MDANGKAPVGNEDKKNDNKKVFDGPRNLLLLGLISILIAISTTGVSLAIYHNSGDIYLDRSRPGFLPDEEEIEEDNDNNDTEYVFEKSGVLTAEILEEYLKNLTDEGEAVQAYEKPFDAQVLSDEHLGIIKTVEGSSVDALTGETNAE